MSAHIDIVVGRRIRHQRWLAGVSQRQLAEMLRMSCQQIQKYECGANRVSASVLWQIKNALQAHIDFFFESVAIEDIDEFLNIPSRISNEAAELMRCYEKMSPSQRKCLLDACRQLASDIQREPLTPER